MNKREDFASIILLINKKSCSCDTSNVVDLCSLFEYVLVKICLQGEFNYRDKKMKAKVLC